MLSFTYFAFSMVINIEGFCFCDDYWSDNMLCLVERSNIVLNIDITGKCFKARRCWNVALNYGYVIS
jgi:hypothetical protein